MNEYFELLDDGDFDSPKTTSWIWCCPDCGAIFGSKAIPGRTIFPWFGYHPCDGNCKIVTDDTGREIELRALRCECSTSIKRVVSVEQLVRLIKTHM
jgi:hypothetical protein